MYILYTSIYTYRYDMPWYARVFGNEYESLWEYIIYNRYIIQDLVPSSLNSRAWQVKQVTHFESNMRTSRFVCSMCMSFPILQGLNSWIFMVCQGVPKMVPPKDPKPDHFSIETYGFGGFPICVAGIPGIPTVKFMVLQLLVSGWRNAPAKPGGVARIFLWSSQETW